MTAVPLDIVGLVALSAFVTGFFVAAGVLLKFRIHPLERANALQHALIVRGRDTAAVLIQILKEPFSQQAAPWRLNGSLKSMEDWMRATWQEANR